MNLKAAQDCAAGNSGKTYNLNFWMWKSNTEQKKEFRLELRMSIEGPTVHIVIAIECS